MNRPRQRRSLAALDRVARRRSAAVAQDPTLGLLSDILLDEREWSLAEVRRLIALRDAVARRRHDESAPGDPA